MRLCSFRLLQAISVIVDGVTTPLTLHMGNATIGTYSVDVNAPLAGSACQLYYFQVTTGTGEFIAFGGSG